MKSKLERVEEASESVVFTEKHYVITAAVNETPVHAAFWQALQAYCQTHKARLIVVPLRYKNPTSRGEAKVVDDDTWYAEEVEPFLYRGRAQLCPNLTLVADVITQPTAVRPLSGLSTFGGLSSKDSVIFAHPKRAMETVATQAGKMAKWAATTGACTEAWYSDTKAGAKGAFHHAFAALSVEVDGDIFHLRRLNAKTVDGSFFDLTARYSATGQMPETAKVLVCGDLHAVRADDTALAATFFAPDSMMTVLKPAHVILHDVLDFQCASHHNDFMTKFRLYHEGKASVTGELLATCTLLDRIAETSATAHFYVVDSNHDQHYARWLNGTEGAFDKQNTLNFHRTRVAWMEAIIAGEPFSPLKWWASKHLKAFNRFTFLTSNDSLVFDGVEYSQHGDKAANGVRGSRLAFTRVGTKMVIGHGHSPGEDDGVVQVGTLSQLNMDYNSGFSGWLHTNCAVDQHGKCVLLTSINGKWKL